MKFYKAFFTKYYFFIIELKLLSQTLQRCICIVCLSLSFEHTYSITHAYILVRNMYSLVYLINVICKFKII